MICVRRGHITRNEAVRMARFRLTFDRNATISHPILDGFSSKTAVRRLSTPAAEADTHECCVSVRGSVCEPWVALLRLVCSTAEILD